MVGAVDRSCRADADQGQLDDRLQSSSRVALRKRDPALGQLHGELGNGRGTEGGSRGSGSLLYTSIPGGTFPARVLR